MLAYIFRRLSFMSFVFLAIILVTFFIVRLIPGNPASVWAGPRASKIQLEKATKELGLDKPIIIQALVYLKNVASGNWGYSLHTKQKVLHDLKVRFMATFELVTLALLIATLIGIPFGIESARHKDKIVDHTSRAISISGVSMPIFWLGMILQMIFFGYLGVFPLQGRVGTQTLYSNPINSITGLYLIDSLIQGNFAGFVDVLKHLILPTLTLSFASVALITRQTRSSMAEIVNAEYIRTSHSFGYHPFRTLYSHGLKNAMPPILTVIGLSYGYLLGGTFLVESIFDWPGIGNYAVDSIMTSDFPAVMGTTIMFAGTYILVNFIVDLLYGYFDPRLAFTAE